MSIFKYRSSNNPLSLSIHRLINTLLIGIFLVSYIPLSHAQTLVNLPAPGTMVHLTGASAPVILKGIKINSEDPLQFNFIVDSGDKTLSDDEFERHASKVIEYFMVALTVPENDLWVNLSPYENNRIIAERLGKTRLGIDMLAQDYMLKQLTSSLMYPEEDLGGEFWQGIYEKAYEEYGTTDIPVDTFNKVWIVPEKAVVYEYRGGAIIVESKMKVLLEQDYVALQENLQNPSNDASYFDSDERVELRKETSSLIRDLILPEIEREVNEGATFESLRQIYRSIILALWYKSNLKESIISQAYVDQNKIDGVQIGDVDAYMKIYDKYLEAFKVGVFDYIKEDYDEVTQDIVDRKYFSGGITTKDVDGNDLAMIVDQKKVDDSTWNVGLLDREPGRFKDVSVQLSVNSFSGSPSYDYEISEKFFEENRPMGSGKQATVYRHPIKEGKVLKRFHGKISDLIRDRHVKDFNILKQGFNEDKLLKDAIPNIDFVRVAVDGKSEWMMELDIVKSPGVIAGVYGPEKTGDLMNRADDIIRRIDVVSGKILGIALSNKQDEIDGSYGDGEDYINFNYDSGTDQVSMYDPIIFPRLMTLSVDEKRIFDLLGGMEGVLGVQEGLFSEKIGPLLLNARIFGGLLEIENKLLEDNPKDSVEAKKLVMNKAMDILLDKGALKIDFKRNLSERALDQLPTFVKMDKRKNVGGKIVFVKNNKGQKEFSIEVQGWVEKEDEVLGEVEVVLPDNMKSLEHNADQAEVLKLLNTVIDQKLGQGGIASESGVDLVVKEEYFVNNPSIGEGGHVRVYDHPEKDGKVLKRFRSEVTKSLKDHHVVALKKLLDAFQDDEVLSKRVVDMNFVRIEVDGALEWMIEMDYIEGDGLMTEVRILNNFSETLQNEEAILLKERAFDVLERIDNISFNMLGVKLADRLKTANGDDIKSLENFVYSFEEDEIYNIDPINIMKMVLESTSQKGSLDVADKDAATLGDSENLGGIDFNSELLGIESVGDRGSSFEGWGAGNADILPPDFSGFSPIIIDVSPIQSLPLLISDSDYSDEIEISSR